MDRSPLNYLAPAAYLIVRRRWCREMTSAQTELLSNLAALRAAVGITTTLRTILDGPWFASVQQAIQGTSSSPNGSADPTGFLYDFCHPLRGVEWFEKDQELALGGRAGEIDDDGKFAVWLSGLDPIRTILPKIDRRLTAFAALPFKQSTVATKLAELRSARTTPSFKNPLFELSVLGDLALRDVLVDIEDSSTSVDGVIRIDGREILVEATNTVQQVIPDFVGVFSTDPNVEIDQVVKKLRKKVAEGRQLARAADKPAILFLARTHLGAGRESAQIALQECFAVPDFSALSGVVLSDSYRLYATSWNNGQTPDAAMTSKEFERLNAWYGQASCALPSNSNWSRRRSMVSTPRLSCRR